LGRRIKQFEKPWFRQLVTIRIDNKFIFALGKILVTYWYCFACSYCCTYSLVNDWDVSECLGLLQISP